MAHQGWEQELEREREQEREQERELEQEQEREQERERIDRKAPGHRAFWREWDRRSIRQLAAR